MMRGRVAAFAFACALLGSVQAEAANGSNYIHLMNGVDYAAPGLIGGNLPPQVGPAFFNDGIWRCFDRDMSLAPSLVMDPTSPTFGTYSMKVTSIVVVMAGPSTVMDFPNITLSSNFGDCRFITTTSPGGTLVFNYAFRAFGGTFPNVYDGFALGPRNDPTASVGAGVGDIEFEMYLGNVLFLAGGPGTFTPVAFTIESQFSVSTVPISENHNTVLWIRNSIQQGGGFNQYFMFSGDERMVCSGQSSSFQTFSSVSPLTTAGAQPALGLNPFPLPSIPIGGLAGGWEWGIGLGTLDATTVAVVQALNSPLSSLPGNNANGNITWAGAAQGGFDAGQAARKISLTGTYNHVSGSLGSARLGFASYDANNVKIIEKGHPANGRVTLMAVYGADIAAYNGGVAATPPATNNPDCQDRGSLAPHQLGAPIYGAGPLLVLNNFIQSRVVGNFDPLSPNLPAPPAPYGSPPVLANGTPSPPYPEGSSFDTISTTLIASGAWLTVSSHETSIGGLDNAFFSLNTGDISGATGRSNPGVGIDIPVGAPFTSFWGVSFLVYSWPLNGAMPAPYSSNPVLPAGTAIAPGGGGHSLSMGSVFTFWP